MAKMFGRGYGVVEEEKKRREIAAESRKGKLFRFFFKADEEVPIRFLTEEPVCYSEHTLKSADSFTQVPCIGDGCPYCATNKPQFVASWLIVDGREFEAKVYDENNVDTGKKKKVKDRIKVLVRGMTDAGSLKRLSEKYGLVKRPYTVTKTGSGKNTKWEFDRGEEEPLTVADINKYREQLPEKLRTMDFYKILELQVTNEVADDTEPAPSKEEAREAVASKVQQLEEEPKKLVRKIVRK